MGTSFVQTYFAYGQPISGIMFPLFTASNTLVTSVTGSGYLSGVISTNGVTWGAIGYTRVSNFLNTGVWTLQSLSSTETATYQWCAKFTARSGCDPVIINGTCISNDWSTMVSVSGIDHIHADLGVVLTNTSNILMETSGRAHDTDVSALAGILTAVSGLKNDVSGLPGLWLSNSGHALTSQVSGLPAIYLSQSGVALKTDVSALAGTYLACSGFDKILTAVSGLWVNGSGIDKILTAVSGVPSAAGSSIAGIQTTDATVLTSGTLAYDVRMARHFTWNDMVVDKRYTPYRQYHYNGTNMSSWFDIADDSNTATRTRGG